MTREHVTKAAQTADLLVSDLREAMKTATPIESQLIRRLLTEAADLRASLSAMAAAYDHTETTAVTT